MLTELPPQSSRGKTLACLGDWLTESPGKQFWKGKEGWTLLKKEILMAHEQSILMCWKISQGGRRLIWLNSALARTEEEKECLVAFGIRSRLLRRTINMSWGYTGRKLGAQLVISLVTDTENKNASINTLVTKGGLRRISMRCWIWIWKEIQGWNILQAQGVSMDCLSQVFTGASTILSLLNWRRCCGD